MREPFETTLKKKIPLFDGSMGALLASMGYKSRCPELLCLEKPEVIASVHRSYLDAGCSVVITNSLGASSIKLGKSSMAERSAELVTAAVGIARKEAGDDNYVALDIGSTGEFMQPVGTIPMKEMIASFLTEMEAGKAAGADFALLETQTDIAECRAAAIAARKAGMPAAASFTFEKNGRTLTGGSPECCALALGALGVFAMGINCSGGPSEMLKPLRAMRSVSPLPVIVQPNAGLPETDAEGNTTYPYTAEMMQGAMQDILDAGASAIGGCCGTTPEHIRRMAQLLEGREGVQCSEVKETYLCSARTFVTAEEAGDGLCEIEDIEDLYDLEEEDRCAVLTLSGMSAEEAFETVTEAQSMTKTPLAFRAEDAAVLAAALTAYHGVAGVVGDADDAVVREFGAIRL